MKTPEERAAQAIVQQYRIRGACDAGYIADALKRFGHDEGLRLVWSVYERICLSVSLEEFRSFVGPFLAKPEGES